MPRDSQGNYSLPSGTLVADGDTVMASQHNPPFQDVASALTNSLDRRGSGGMLGNLPMNGHRVTNAAPGIADNDLATVGQVSSGGVPIGAMTDYAGYTEPDGWLFCDGRTLQASTYAALFAAIGTTFGSAGAGTFNLPDARNRARIGLGNMGGTSSGRVTTATASPNGNTIGATGGSERHTITTNEMPAHSHTGTTASAGGHNHSVSAPSVGTGGSDIAGAKWTARSSTNYGPVAVTSSTAGNHTHSVTINNTGNGNPHNNMPPFIIVPVIIKAR